MPTPRSEGGLCITLTAIGVRVCQLVNKSPIVAVSALHNIHSLVKFLRGVNTLLTLIHINRINSTHYSLRKPIEINQHLSQAGSINIIKLTREDLLQCCCITLHYFYQGVWIGSWVNITAMSMQPSTIYDLCWAGYVNSLFVFTSGGGVAWAHDEPVTFEFLLVWIIVHYKNKQMKETNLLSCSFVCPC